MRGSPGHRSRSLRRVGWGLSVMGEQPPIVPISPNCLPLKLYACSLAWVMEGILDTDTVVYVHLEIMPPFVVRPTLIPFFAVRCYRLKLARSFTRLRECLRTVAALGTCF
jgi:hypothetical protein